MSVQGIVVEEMKMNWKKRSYKLRPIAMRGAIFSFLVGWQAIRLRSSRKNSRRSDRKSNDSSSASYRHKKLDVFLIRQRTVSISNDAMNEIDHRDYDDEGNHQLLLVHKASMALCTAFSIAAMSALFYHHVWLTL